MLNKLVDALIDRAKKTPYVHIDDYMERFWLLGSRSPERNKSNGHFVPTKINWLYRLITKYVAIRVHHIMRSDHDRSLHDHPFSYIAVILKGGYWEITEFDLLDPSPLKSLNSLMFFDGKIHRKQWYGPGSILVRKIPFKHRLCLPEGKDAWTLFIMGQRLQRWGFFTKHGKMFAEQYLQGESNASDVN